MARVNIPLSNLAGNASLADPAGTAADETDGHNITGQPLEELFLRVVLDTAGDAANVTVKAGDNPPSLSAGQGDLVVACADNAATFIGPFESARFSQSDGSLDVDIDDETGVTITAFHMPRDV